METIGNTSCACETRANVGTVRGGRRIYLYLLAGVAGIIICVPSSQRNSLLSESLPDINGASNPIAAS